MSRINKREVIRRREPRLERECEHAKLATVFNCALSMCQVTDGSSNRQDEQK
jgi:hypothetical protein